MPIDQARFVQVCQDLAKIDLFGQGPPPVAWQGAPTQATVSAAINSGALQLPLAYRNDYITPLQSHLAAVVSQLTAQNADFLIETLAGAVYDHSVNSPVSAQLQRFLAVISNLYRSFLSDAKRAAVGVPASFSQLPPLAMFQNDGGNGPYTLPADAISQLCGSSIGVVSLPSTYRDHPIVWAALAHETGGHDVTHADSGLLDELAARVQAMFGGGPLQPGRQPTPAQLSGLLWSYWIDEATADAYGILNIGPQFALNLVAFFSALNAQGGNLPLPSLRTQSGHPANDPRLDVHPTDILRPYLAIGVIQSMSGLSSTAKAAYVADIKRVTTWAGHGARSVQLSGEVEVDRDRWINVNLSKSLTQMQQDAQRVGALIATAHLQTLGNHSIQDVESWDDSDDQTAAAIAHNMGLNQSVVDAGDDAQLLAGATQALLASPGQYAQITALLNAALDASYAHDPIFGTPGPHPMYVRYAMPAAPGLEARTEQTARAVSAAAARSTRR